MELALTIIALAFFSTIIATVAIVYGQEKVASKAVGVLPKLLGNRKPPHEDTDEDITE